MAADPVDRDEKLLDALVVALRPASAEPSMAELAGLQRAVAGVGAAPGRASRVRRRLLAVAAVVVVGSGGTAYAGSPSSPREVRSVAHAIKLPGVEAPDLTDVRKALDDLAEELDDAAGRGRVDQVRSALEDVEEELGELSAAQRAALEPRLSALLGRADDVLAAAAPAEAAEREAVAEDEADGGGADDEADEVEADELEDSSGSGASGSGSSGSESSGSGSGDVDEVDEVDEIDSSGTGSSGSGSGSGSGSDDTADVDDLDGSSGRGGGDD